MKATLTAGEMKSSELISIWGRNLLGVAICFNA